MMTGDSYNLPIQIETSMGFANMGTFEDMEVMFGDVRKTISNGEIKYDTEKQAFLASEMPDTVRLLQVIHIIFISLRQILEVA